MEKETFSQRAWEKDYDRDIKETYGKIKELLKKSPWAEEVLTTLVELEKVVDQKLFATLNAKYGESRGESTVKQGFDSSPKWRNYLESKTLESVVGEKTTTDQLLAVFAKKFDEIIKNKSLSPEEKLKELGIKYIKTDKMILPPDPEYRRIQTGSGKWWKEPWPDYDRIGRLVWLLKNICVYTTDYTVIVWTNTENAMRRESYVMFQIPKLNKTILVNNCYGEATFIYDGILEYDDVVAYSKKDLSSQLTKIIFSHSKKEAWDVQILGELTRIKQEVKEKRENGELSEPKSVKEIFKANREAISNEKKREEITKFFLKNYGTKIEITKENEKDYTFPEEESNGLNIFTGKKNEQLYIFTEGEERNVYTFTEEDKEKLIMMTQKERSELKITVWGESQGLLATARTFWLKEGNPISLQKDREKLLSETIKGEIKSRKEIFKTKFIERLENKFGKNIESFTEEDKEGLVIMTKEERNKAFEITVWGKPQSLDKITTACCWVKGKDAYCQEDREKLLSEIIKGEIKSKKEIFKTKFIECLENKFGKNIESFTDEDKETLVIMTVEERNKAFEITVWGESQSLDKITTACCWVKGKDYYGQEDREKLLSEIFKGGIKSKEEITGALNEEIRKETIKYFNEHYATKKIENWKEVYVFTEEDKEKLIMMTIEERSELKISAWGEYQGLQAIARTLWLKEGNPTKTQKDREKLLSEIIKGEIKSKEEIFKTKFIEYLENKFGKNIESFTDEDKEKLIMMTQKERSELRIIVWGEPQGLFTIATACWLKEENPVGNPKDREKLLSEIIGEKIKSKEEITNTLNEEIRKETIKYFNEHYATKKIENWKVIYVFTEEDKEKLVMMEAREKKELKITVWGESQGLQAIARTFWLKGGDPRSIQKDREALISEVIWEKIKSKEEIFKAKFIECLENKFGKNIESFTNEDLEKLITMTGEERNKAFVITVWGESQSLDKITTACCWVKGKDAYCQEDREKLLSEIIWAKIKSKKELIKKYFIKDFPTTKEAKEKLATMTERGKIDYKISIQGRKIGLRSMTKDFWIKGNPIKDIEVLEQLIDTIWTYEPPEEKSLSLAKDRLQAHHCELNKEALLEEVNSTNTDEGAKVLQ